MYRNTYSNITNKNMIKRPQKTAHLLRLNPHQMIEADKLLIVMMGFSSSHNYGRGTKGPFPDELSLQNP